MRCLQYAPLWRATRGELCSKESRHTTHDSRELLSSREWPSMDVCNCKFILKMRFTFLGYILIQGEKEKEEVMCLLIWLETRDLCLGARGIATWRVGNCAPVTYFEMMVGTVPWLSKSEVVLTISWVTTRISFVLVIEFNSNCHI